MKSEEVYLQKSEQRKRMQEEKLLEVIWGFLGNKNLYMKVARVGKGKGSLPYPVIPLRHRRQRQP